ncbi:MAG TPA: amino acid adenylation domain-containing protein [Herpetosiphonaceae bacterium]
MRLEDFLAQLQVEVTLEPLVEGDLAHVAYLTERTAEFHLTGRARSVDELATLLEADQSGGWLVAVRDRFGDYGVAGAIVVAWDRTEALVDSFVLNCRVLGKQVEDLTLQQVAHIVQARGCERIRLVHRATPRNGAAAAFVEHIAGDRLQTTEDGCQVTLPLAVLTTAPTLAAPSQRPRAASSIARPAAAAARHDSSAASDLLAMRWERLAPTRRSALVSEIATTLRSGDRILAQIRQRRRHSRELTQHYAPPRTELERSIAVLWQELLGVDQVGRDDDFFALGGHSLLAAQVVGRLRSAYHMDLPLRRLFEHPTIAELARCIEQTEPSTAVPQVPIVPVPRDEPLPLSFAQRRLWFLDQLQPGNAAYNVPTAVRLHGPLDLAALEQALNAVIARHETLRTTIGVRDGDPIQVIAPTLRMPLQAIDLRAHPTSERESAALDLATSEAQQPFDLERGPLIRAVVIQIDRAEHLLVLVLHHIISDGWSMGVLVEELAALYQALLAHTPPAYGPAGSPLAIQYADFAVWQRQWLQDAALERLRAYWKQQLSERGALPILQLPIDRPRPALPSGRGARHSFELRQPLAEALRTFSQREGATLFMTLLAAFATLLSRYTGQTDLPIGTPIANRARPELERLIGFFANTLVLRVGLDGAPTFRALLRRVRDLCLGAYAHQELPFEQLVEMLQPERDLSRHALFQVMFVLQNTPLAALKLPSLSFEPVRLDSGTTKFDLTLTFVEQGGGLLGTLEYNTDIFVADTIARLAEHLTVLLRGIVADSERPLRDLPWLTERERRTLVTEWNATDVSYPQHGSLHALIEAQAARTPDAIAVVFQGQRLSYDELNRRANQLAHHLRRHGVGPSSLVGVSLERSLDLVVALVGILKAGAAYVPFDPSYPHERLQFMIEDAQVPVLVTQSQLLARLPETSALRICLDDADLLRGEPAHNPEVALDLDDLAYVIYTSGSTGKPKGAMNTHRGICNRLLWIEATYPLAADDRLLQKTPFSFDVSVWEFFWPLISGATLVVARPEGHKDPEYLIDVINREQITTIHFVPSMLRVFLEAPNVESCTRLRRVLCSGEALPVEVQARFFARLKAKLYNLYGPTETAVEMTYWDFSQPHECPIVPIGRPIANTQIYVLDRYDQPVPVGVSGELHIGGVQVARGYHNRPALTAEKFIPHPFSSIPGARLYRSGDLVRALPDGNMEFLGRIDYQVKLHGLRIELEEIEAVLRQHPAVHDAVVVVRDDHGGQRLVAYVVANKDAGHPLGMAPGTANSAADDSCSQLSVLGSADVRQHLGARLPEYMIPSAFVFLDELPLSPNGKVERKALPAPQAASTERESRSSPPRTPLEQRLARAWADVLNLTQIGIDDNFFEVGGDSFRAIQLAQRLEHAVSVVDVLKHQTIREQAAFMQAGLPAERSILHRIGGPQRPAMTLVCVPYGGGNAIAYRPLAQALPPDYALYAVQLPGHDLSAQDEPLEPVEAIARRCVEAIRQLDQPVALYGHCAAGCAISVEIARLLQAAGTPAQAIFLGALLPPRPRRFGLSLPRLSLLNSAVPDTLLHNYLKRLGAFDGQIDSAELRFIMKLFRHDGRCAMDYFERVLHAESQARLQSPVFCLVGDSDPLPKIMRVGSTIGSAPPSASSLR